MTVTVKVAHMRLCHSRMLFVRAYPRETQEMVFDAHDRAFALFNGTCGRGIYDNMKTAVDAIFVGKRPPLQSPLPSDVQPLPGRASSPARRRRAGRSGTSREPGRVGARALLHRRGCGSRPSREPNAWLLDKCVAHAKAHRHPELVEQTIWEVFEAERPKLVPYVGRFDGFHAVPLRQCSKTCLVRFGQQQILSGGQRGRAAGRDPCLCRDRIVIRPGDGPDRR